MELAAIPLTLIAIVGALMLLAKAQKEALHDIFKYASYFILTLCIFTLSLVCIKAFDHCRGGRDIRMMHHEMNCPQGMCAPGECGPGKGNMMMFRKEMGGPGCCMEKMGDAGCPMGDEGECEKEVIIKDTIIKK